MRDDPEERQGEEQRNGSEDCEAIGTQVRWGDAGRGKVGWIPN